MIPVMCSQVPKGQSLDEIVFFSLLVAFVNCSFCSSLFHSSSPLQNAVFQETEGQDVLYVFLWPQRHFPQSGDINHSPRKLLCSLIFIQAFQNCSTCSQETVSSFWLCATSQDICLLSDIGAFFATTLKGHCKVTFRLVSVALSNISRIYNIYAYFIFIF